MSTSTYVNILFDDLGSSNSSDDQQESTSAGPYSHIDAKSCPVCKQEMAEASIGSEKVFFCKDHRISIPCPDDM